MNIKLFATLSIALIISACQTTTKNVSEQCPMPEGYILSEAIPQAEATINRCPQKFDQIFHRVIDIGKHKPDAMNSIHIQEMIKRLVRNNKVSERYSKTLYQSYLSIQFTSFPEIRPASLPAEIDSIKIALQRELAMKKEGIIECCADQEMYAKAEQEYARRVRFIEDLSMNVEYTNSLRK